MKKWVQSLVIVGVVAIIAFGGYLVGLYTDWLWFKDVGYSAVFIKTLTTKLALFAIFGFAFFAVFYLNAMLTRKLKPPAGLRLVEELIKLRAPIIDRFLDRLVLALALVFSLMAGSAAAAHWEEALLFFNQVPFGIKDPVFSLDLSFFVFRLPFLRFIWSSLFSALVVSAVAAIALHVIDGAIGISMGRPSFADHVKAHISSMAAAACLMFAAGFRLLQYGLLYSTRGTAYGASYTDIHAELPVFGILAVVSLITAVLFLINIKIKGWKLPIIAGVFLGSALILVGGVYPVIIQQYKVSPNEIAVEKPYIKRSIAFTRSAYGLNAIDARPYAADKELTAEVLDKNKATVENIRLWDWRPLLKTFNQLQAFRLYYDFHDVDIDRYELDGKYTQVTLAAREINTAQLPETAKTWVNQHQVYTHGYGIVMNPVNKITSEGLPELVIKDIPPSADVLKIDEPRIYYGEKTDDYVLVNTETREFDYPQGDANQYTKYSGDSGVSIGGIVNKLMFAMRFGSLRLLLSSALTQDTKVLFHRNIGDRVDTIAPFLAYDGDPYLVAAPDKAGKTRLFWIYDAYTMTDMYPYSKPFDDAGDNYIRNSVKVVIDAYNGSTDYYLVDKDDPVAEAYGKAFPGFFKDGAELPAELRKHLRYPEDLFNVQAYMFATYHMTDPQVFYNKEDMWEVAKENVEGTQQPIDPYYMIMQLGGEKTEHFRLITPFTPANKNNMIAWLSADCDGTDYGKLVVYKFSKETLVFGPTQVEARIDQDPTISQFLTLVSQRGSSVTRGPLLVIPLDGSLIYVQPLYIQAEHGELPELKRVFVAYGDKVIMAVDLTQALEAIFGISDLPPEAGQTETGTETAAAGSAQLIKQALEHYDKAIAAQKTGDWTTYGQELKAMEDILRQLEALSP